MRDADRELAGSSYLGERHTRHEAALVKIQCLADPGCAGWVAGLFGPAPLWQRGAIEGCDLGQVFDPKCLVNGLGLGRTRLLVDQDSARRSVQGLDLGFGEMPVRPAEPGAVVPSGPGRRASARPGR